MSRLLIWLHANETILNGKRLNSYLSMCQGVYLGQISMTIKVKQLLTFWMVVYVYFNTSKPINQMLPFNIYSLLTPNYSRQVPIR